MWGKTKYRVAVRVAPSEYKHFTVSREVYIYIRQLELAVQRRGKVMDALKKLYPERFSAVKEEKGGWKE